MATVIEFRTRDAAPPDASTSPVARLSDAADAILSTSRHCQSIIARLSTDLDELERLAAPLTDIDAKAAMLADIEARRLQLTIAARKLSENTDCFAEILEDVVPSSGARTPL